MVAKTELPPHSTVMSRADASVVMEMDVGSEEVKTRAAAHKGKNPCPTLARRKTKAL